MMKNISQQNCSDSDLKNLKVIESPLSAKIMSGPSFDYQNKFSQKVLEEESDINPEQQFSNQNILSCQAKSRRTINMPLFTQRNENLKPVKKAQSFGLKRFLLTQTVKNTALKWILKAQIFPRSLQIQDILKETYMYEKDEDSDYIKQNSLFPVIKLTNQYLILWNIWRFCQYLIMMWWFPFKLAFSQDSNALEKSLLGFILLDVIIKLNVEIIHEGQIINDRQKIMDHYYRNFLISDLIYIISFVILNFVEFQIILHQFVQIIFFYTNLSRMKRIITEYQESQTTINELYNLIELLLIVYFIAHFMACVWFYIGDISQIYYSESWILKTQIATQSVYTQYLYSFYWATATMVTVGYGDITAQNPYEVLCTTVLMFISSGVFAFSISSIGMILTNFNQSKVYYKRTLLLINSYMVQNNVSQELQNKIRNYLKFYINSENMTNQNEVKQIVELLQGNLRQELLFDVQSKIVVENQWLRKYFSASSLQKIAQVLEQIQCTPQEFIFQKGGNDNYLYFLQKGQIAFMDKNSGKIIKEYHSGDCFGEFEFFSCQPRNIYAKSIKFSQVLRIKRDFFYEIVQKDNQDLQNFFYLKDLFSLHLSVKCYLCQQDHLTWDCSKLFYKPNLERLIKTELFYSRQDRKKVDRKTAQKCNAKYYQNGLEQTVKNYRNQNPDTFEQTAKSEEEIGSIIQNSYNPKEERRNSILKLMHKKTESFREKSELASQIDYEREKHKPSQLSPRQRQQQLKPQHSRQSGHQIPSLSQLPPVVLSSDRENSYVTTPIKLQHRQQEFEEFEEQKEYSSYFPQNNVNFVVTQFQKFQMRQKYCKKLMFASKYRFFQIKQLMKDLYLKSRQAINI